MSVNKQIIIGNLGEDPKVRLFQDGSKSCRFTVAVTEKGYTMQNGTQVPEHTEWFNILVRGSKAGVAEQFLHKGDKVYIEGKTFTGEYQDQQSVTKRYTEVRCEVLELLTPKAQAQPQQGNMPHQSGQQYQPQQAVQFAAQPQYAPAAPQPTIQPAPQPQYAPAAPQPVGVFGQPAQAVPVTDKPW